MNIPFLAGIAIIIFGDYLLIHALISYKKARSSCDWLKVAGKLTDVRLWGKRNINGEMKDADRLSVEYEYEVDGQSYSGSTAAFYTLLYPETTEFAEAHPVGHSVDIYYNPTNPAESVIIPGPRKGNKRYSDLILGGICNLIGIIIALAGWLGYLG